MKVTAVTAAALLAALQSLAQTTDKPHTVKSYRVHLGIDFGADFSTLRTTNTDQQAIKEVKNTRRAGFRMGLLAEYPLSKQLSVILAPELSSDNTSLAVLRTDNSRHTYETPVNLSTGAHVKYKAVIGQVNPYILIGPRYEIPIITGTNGTDQMARPNVSMDLGVGAERAFPHFIVIPEVRYSYGLSNTGAIPGIQETKRQTVSLIFSFRG